VNDAIFILAGTGFLAGAALAVFALIVISIHRTPRVPMSETSGKRPGAFARRVITGVRTDAEDGDR
jgi:hypothetical protein